MEQVLVQEMEEEPINLEADPVEIERKVDDEETKKEKIEVLREKANKMVEFISHEGWKHSSTKKVKQKDKTLPKEKQQYHYIVHKMADKKTGLNFVKGEGIIDFPANEIKEFLKDQDLKKTYDKTWMGNKVLEEFDEECGYEYFRVKGPPMVSDRDFCVLRGIFDIEQYTVAVAFSQSHPDAPNPKGVVRGEILMGGWVIEPLKEDPTKSYAYYLMQINIKGLIPKMVVNQITKLQGFLPMRVNEAMKKHFRKD